MNPDANNELVDKTEPTLDLISPYPRNIEYTFRPEINEAKASMGVHPLVTDVPFEKRVFAEATFYRIEGMWWQKGYVGSDDEGIFVTFWRVDGKYTGNYN
jgi:hypothetical protein